MLLAAALAGCPAGPPDDAPTVGVEVVRTPVCADPGARDAGAFDGRVTVGGDWTFAPDFETAQWDLKLGARGLVLADFDADGHLDSIAPQVHEKTRLLLGDGAGGFTDHPLPDLPELQGLTGGSAADFDGDGDLDVFLYGQGHTPELQSLPPGTAVMLVNDGAAGFGATAHPEWDDPGLGGCGGSASWGDMDLDGDLDLYFGRLGMTLPSGESYFCGSKLLRNDDGVLTDASDGLPAESKQMRVLASGFLPFDDDPEPELYVVADALMEQSTEGPVAGSDLLLDGDGDYAIVDGTGLDVAIAGMGLAAGDPNGDGVIDVVAPGVDELLVLMSVGGGTMAWVDASAVTGIAPAGDQHSGWGGEWDDLDYDGILDLVMAFGAFADPTQGEPDEIFRGTADGGYERVGEAWGFADRFPTRGFVVADVNEDGWPDVVKRELGGPVFVYPSQCGDQHWLQLSLAQAGANPDAIGAVVTVVQGGHRRTRYVTAGSTSYQIGGPPVVQIGLGSAGSADDIEVVWPDGARGRTGPVDADRWLRLVR